MEEWCAKVEGLLQGSLKAEEERKILQTATTFELEKRVVKINDKIAERDGLLRNIQEESDSVMARSMKLCEEVESLRERQGGELRKVRETLEEARLSNEKADQSRRRINNVFLRLSDPKTAFSPPVTFTLTNFHELKDNSEIWYSPSFYSHRCGYKMQLQVYPNGDGEGQGTHVSVKIALVPGEFDDLLSWPYRGIVTLHLLNQRGRHNNQYHVVHEVWLTSMENLYMREKPVVGVEGEEQALRIGEGKDKFIAHTDLGENAWFFADKEYLKNNSLNFCVWNAYTFYHHH